MSNLGSYVTTSYRSGNNLPSSDWSSRMYLEITAQSHSACRAMCFYDINCIIYTYYNYKCYLGDPGGTYAAVSSQKSLTIYGDYGNSLRNKGIFIKAILFSYFTT